MPYEGEYAGYAAVRRLAESKRVKDLLAELKIRQAPASLGEGSLLFGSRVVRDGDVPRRKGWIPDYAIAIDGGLVPVPVRNGYPGAEAGYITVACVLVDVKRMRELNRSRPVDPRLMRETRETQPVDGVLPGCNVVFEGEMGSASSFRRALFEKFFSDYRAFSDGETLLDTYHALLAHKAGSRPQRCPYGEACGKDPTGAYVTGTYEYTCSCPRRLPLFSTDALGVHERFNPLGSNGRTFGEVLQILERLWLVHVLRGMESQGHLNALARVAVFVDGPLAIYGDPAPFSLAISKELARINERLRSATGEQLLVVGIEKTGLFVDHFELICRAADKGLLPYKFEPGSALLLTNDYIRKHIEAGTEPYGKTTYFGRKLLYRTRGRAQIVASLPFLEPGHDDLDSARPDQYARLGDALDLFDGLASSRYPNALFPVSLAHSEASIPISHGARVLERLARELVGTEERR